MKESRKVSHNKKIFWQPAFFHDSNLPIILLFVPRWIETLLGSSYSEISEPTLMSPTNPEIVFYVCSFIKFSTIFWFTHSFNFVRHNSFSSINSLIRLNIYPSSFAKQSVLQLWWVKILYKMGPVPFEWMDRFQKTLIFFVVSKPLFQFFIR